MQLQDLKFVRADRALALRGILVLMTLAWLAPQRVVLGFEARLPIRAQGPPRRTNSTGTTADGILRILGINVTVIGFCGCGKFVPVCQEEMHGKEIEAQ